MVNRGVRGVRAAPRLDGIDPVRSLCDRYTHRNLVFEPNAGIEPEFETGQHQVFQL